MTTPPGDARRRGSFLVVCLAMMSLVAIVGFALLKQLRTQTDASTANQRAMLAEGAAQAGVAHALEQVLRDHAGATIEIRSDAGAAPARALTFLDGPYRAPFGSLSHPNTLTPWNGAETNAPDADKDVRPEHMLTLAWLPWWMGDPWATRFSWYEREGTQHYDGRGRYYEPGWYDLTRTPGDEPVRAVPFVEFAGPKPERDGAVFYDERFVRLDSGDPVADRKAARYRLRYAIGVEDLQGHLLVNPQADMRLPQDYRTPPAWVRRSGDAFAAIMGAAGHPDWFVDHWQHVFQGRGWSVNVDKGAGGHPVTFPLMYRWSDRTSPEAFWECYRKPEGGARAEALYASTYVRGLAAGGETIRVDGHRWWGPRENGGGWPYGMQRYMHVAVGPQYSWWNLYYALTGCSPDWGANIPATMFMATPFGRPITRTPGYPGDYQPATRRWHQARVDTPFHVNVMTAPPAVVSAMLLAYLPPKFKVFKYTRIDFYRYTGKVRGNDTWERTPGASMALDGRNGLNNVSYYGRDLLVDATHPGFAEFPAPRRDGASSPPSLTGEVITPDYHVLDQRGAQEQYPGLAWNGDSSRPGEGTDDLGEHIDADEVGNGVCTHTGLPFIFMGLGPAHYHAKQFPGNDAPLLTVRPPDWFWEDGMNLAVKVPDPDLVKFQHSYWWDIYSSLATAISVMRAQWVQYPNDRSRPAQAFPAGDLDPTAFQTMRDLDRQFLAQLGESLDAPGSDAPAALGLKAYRPQQRWTSAGSYWEFEPRTTSNNIRSLLDQDLIANIDGSLGSDQRARVMERVLNDVRLSFLGSSPEYADGIDWRSGATDAAAEFRPLDFDGDGEVACSCYPAALAVAEGDGRGPKPPAEGWFSVTGCFFVGKSRFFRIWSRGELWDNRLSRTISEALLESAVCIDPEGQGTADSHVLYQRWHFDKYQGLLSHIEP
ncbi:MAG TPA: hypothetical protein VEL07_00550 [Planctomycetota bacterium]|nr:hypothetical protein [Planctomycetota bacterium]